MSALLGAVLVACLLQGENRSWPGKVILDRKVEIPRPRKLDDMYGREVVELVQDLRHHINVARSEG